MIDDTKYDYVELTMPNIVMRVEKRPKDYTCFIDAHTRPFVEALATKYPQWRFVGAATDFGVSDTDTKQFMAKQFLVQEGRDHLGVIGSSFIPLFVGVYTVDNDRIRSSRLSSTRVETKDLKKAIRTVGKMFGAKTLNGRLWDTHLSVEETIALTQRDRNSKFHRSYTHIVDALLPHIMDNYEHFITIALHGGASAETVHRLPRDYEEREIVNRIAQRRKSKLGLVVLKHGNDYIVEGDKGKESRRIFPCDSLPTHIKRAVGLLKLVEDKHFIKDVGLRVNDNAFYICDEANNE